MVYSRKKNSENNISTKSILIRIKKKREIKNYKKENKLFNEREKENNGERKYKYLHFEEYFIILVFAYTIIISLEVFSLYKESFYKLFVLVNLKVK